MIIFENELITRKLIFVIFFRQRIKNYETIRIQIKSQNLILNSSLLLMRMIFQNLLVIEVKKKCFISDKTRFQSHFYLILRLLFQSRIFFQTLTTLLFCFIKSEQFRKNLATSGARSTHPKAMIFG